MKENLPELPVVDEASFDLQVLRSPVPVLVVFTAGWCTWCRQLDPVVRDLQDETRGRLLVVKVDTEASPAIAGRYDVRGLPSMVLLDQGRQVWSHVGFLGFGQLVMQIYAAWPGTKV